MTESVEPCATSEENATMWDQVCFEPVSEYSGFGGPEEVQIDDNGMFYDHYLKLTYLIKLYKYQNNNPVILYILSFFYFSEMKQHDTILSLTTRDL